MEIYQPRQSKTVVPERKIKNYQSNNNYLELKHTNLSIDAN